MKRLFTNQEIEIDRNILRNISYKVWLQRFVLFERQVVAWYYSELCFDTIGLWTIQAKGGVG
ncbi:MAG: hypothetical protein US54_C0034G0005 [Candidatus Roizmanbacteria bacterium GW2011_GWA2_37_7]|uniref:Uncharacterized protein n=1 Tax=Candidatus Roizmanbacteria bacterium GW2011_GWA2_37_7 TaxID=1618481 RepID=A0A0G0H2I9_9BACT|nr:MAG: hypothetical protein US54_C0034G0005 [Candidatus Roizmanbacteria bacterium GW2011_GWA2_37_7]